MTKNQNGSRSPNADHAAEIESLKKEVEAKHNQYLRALADYHNLEKRSQINQTNEIRRTMVAFLKGLVEIKKDLDQASLFHQDEGLKLIRQKFDGFLNQHQVREINPLDQPFSPDKMECVQTEPGQKADIVTRVLEKGYTYNDELLQPAKVVVSRLEVSTDGGEKNK